MGKVLIFTKVFRYEPIVKKSIESVLNQTYQDFIYYLWVSEETHAIARQYAEKDKRIRIAMYDEWPRDARYCDIFRELLQKEKAEYLCVSDADDLMMHGFIENMKSFLDANHLDIAFCDVAYFDENGRVYHEKKKTPIVVTDREMFKQQFQNLYKSMRTVWGTLFTAKSILEADYSYMPVELDKRIYGGDTEMVLTTMRTCERIGLLNEELYAYNMRQGVSKNYYKSRRDADVFLFHFAEEFMKDKRIESESNMNFLYLVLYNAVGDTVNVIANSLEEKKTKIEDIYYMFCFQEVQEAFLRKKIIYDANGWKGSPIKQIFNEKIIPDELEADGYRKLVEIYKGCNPKFRGLEIEECFSEWIRDEEGLEQLYKQGELYSIIYLLSFLHLMPERKMLEALCLADKLCNVPWLKKYLAEYIFVCDAKTVLCDILKNNAEKVFMGIESKLEVGNEFTPVYLELYKDYAAVLNEEERFVNAWLLQCEWYINAGEILKAKEELAEIKSMGIDGEWLNELEARVETEV